MPEETKLSGKIAVITGAGRGIGRAIALRFAKAGANLAICARSGRELEDVQNECQALGVQCVCKEADLANPDEVEGFCTATLSEFEQIHVLVNNAGAYLDRGTFAESDPEDWWRTVEVNVRGPYLMTRFLLKGMMDGGKIINLTSGKGFSAGQNSSSYHVSKAGLNMFSQTLANELWPRNIDVNLVVPGPVATTTFSREDPSTGVTAEDILDRFANDLPAGLPACERLKHPDEVADLVIELASWRQGGPTGQIFSLARRPI